ncbi:unnamed protein product [Diabrotica balteata]|uniref:Uncharacterized protein n=1 Tax=Diabrotica balteata TaxID=107213 RepID=A0A9N9ST94_DIABA|nr:unnamed protein product [Diabrotica balteata]
MNNLQLQQYPARIWNADETAFNYGPSRNNVLTGIGEIAQKQTAGAGRKTTTVLACAMPTDPYCHLDDENSEEVVYAESNDSYEAPNDNMEEGAEPQVQEPTDDNIIPGKYIVVRINKRAVTHSIGLICQINALKRVVIMKCLKRCVGNAFKFREEIEPLLFTWFERKSLRRERRRWQIEREVRKSSPSRPDRFFTCCPTIEDAEAARLPHGDGVNGR